MTERRTAKSHRPLLPSSPVQGFCVCFLWGIALPQILNREFLGPVGNGFFPILLGLLGTFLCGTRARKAVDIGMATTVVAFIAIGYTPLVYGPTHRWIQTDSLKPCPAVVVLSSDVWPDGTLDSSAEDRFLRGIELIHRKLAVSLVITRLAPPGVSSLPTVKTEMSNLGIAAPIFQVGPATNTHDEALKVAALARSRRWNRILLVTSPLHARRARAVFAKAGLDVIVQSTPERAYDLATLSKVGDRYKAFRDWTKEVVGYRIYQARGWID